MSNTEPLLRVGIIADVQAYDREDDWGIHNLRKALQILAPKNLDVILNLGDISDGAYESVYNYYGKVLKDTFKEKMPLQLSCAGNHDFWIHDAEVIDPVYGQFCRGIGQKEENPCHYVVNGYSFIAISAPQHPFSGYTAEHIAALEKEIKQAIARDSEKPVFVLSHFPPAQTMSGSYSASGREELRQLFDRYKQVVSLSGHTHYPLEDERCIWQGKFTAFTCATLAYGCMSEEHYVNNCNGIIPFAREAVQAMYMEIFADRLEIHRYNVEDQREIKPDRIWTMPLPFDPAAAVFTAARREKRQAPQFAPDTQIYLRYDYGYIFLLFDGAEHDDFVHSYHVVLWEKGADGTLTKAMELDYAGNFYRLDRNRDKRQVIRLPGAEMKQYTDYKVEIYPRESFGLQGEPISLVVNIGRRKLKPITDLPPQE